MAEEDKVEKVAKVKEWIVGGCVRDEMLGRPAHDVDIAIEGFEDYDAFREHVTRDAGVIVCVEKRDLFCIRCKKAPFGYADFVHCRQDGPYKDGRHPVSVVPGNIMTDLARRDFTMNAMAKDTVTREILDPFGGRQDIKMKIIRAVGPNPQLRFQEDALRILRAMRFAIILGFTIEPATLDAMIAEKHNLSKLSSCRIYEELKRCFAVDSSATLAWITRLGISEILFRECGVSLLPTLKKS